MMDRTNLIIGSLIYGVIVAAGWWGISRVVSWPLNFFSLFVLVACAFYSGHRSAERIRETKIPVGDGRFV